MVGLLAVLCFLTGFSLMTQGRIARESKAVDTKSRAGTLYQDMRFWVGQEESLERKYRLEPGPDVRARHANAEQAVVADLEKLEHYDLPTANHLLGDHARYEGAIRRMFDAVDANRPRLVLQIDHDVADPIFDDFESEVFAKAKLATQRSLAASAKLRGDEVYARDAMAVAFGIGLLLLGSLGVLAIRFRRRLEAAELHRLAELALSDPLTGLRNQRAFQEDVGRELQQVARTGLPLALVMIDLEELKVVNESEGHRAGDERLCSVAEALLQAGRGADCAYRIAGDHFAVLLTDTRAWGALEFAQRVEQLLTNRELPILVTAGIAEALELRRRESLIRDADLALMAAKTLHQSAAVFTPEVAVELVGDGDGRQRRTLANALARAVDAKDSYTRSHCQTVSQLCALIAAEVGLDRERSTRLRLAGLLHDVGKIGVPDAILNKPARLTEEEFEVMKEHVILGHEIVASADLPVEAEWVRHHHERIDGHGYPDGLAGDEIPFESRIILVADAYEAMTSDRPYRRAPGQAFAIQELRKHAGTQFDPDVVEALCRVLGRAPALGRGAPLAAAQRP